MSKASDFAKSMKGKGLIFAAYNEDLQEEDTFAWVEHHGNFQCYKNTRLTPEEALALAKWINDTFGDSDGNI